MGKIIGGKVTSTRLEFNIVAEPPVEPKFDTALAAAIFQIIPELKGGLQSLLYRHNQDNGFSNYVMSNGAIWEISISLQCSAFGYSATTPKPDSALGKSDYKAVCSLLKVTDL